MGDRLVTVMREGQVLGYIERAGKYWVVETDKRRAFRDRESAGRFLAKQVDEACQISLVTSIL